MSSNLICPVKMKIEYAEQLTKKEEKIPYQKYRKIIDKIQFYKEWEKNKLAELTGELKIYIYNKYVVKCKVLNRDDFICQNYNGKDGKCSVCKNVKFYHKLTIHHIKFKKNEGKDKARNCVTLCNGSHTLYHKAKGTLVFLDTDNLPSHIKNHTFKLERPDEFDWKKLKSDMKDIRREIKFKLDESIKKFPIGQRKWFRLTAEQILLLMKWLTIPYDEFDEA